jgi:hypothetical protein
MGGRVLRCDCQLWLSWKLTLAQVRAHLVRLEALQFGSRHDFVWVSAVALRIYDRSLGKRDKRQGIVSNNPATHCSSSSCSGQRHSFRILRSRYAPTPRVAKQPHCLLPTSTPKNIYSTLFSETTS